MKSLRLLIIFSLFCMLCLCAGRGFFFSAIGNGSNDAAVQSMQNNATLQDSGEDYIRLVRSSSFVAANTLNNIAEHRAPTQWLSVRGAKLCGEARGAYGQKGRYKTNLCCGGLKVSASAVSYLLQSYHKTVSSLWCCHFSKCYILALGRLLC